MAAKAVDLRKLLPPVLALPRCLNHEKHPAHREATPAEGAEAHLETKFGDHQEPARPAMTALAHAYHPRELTTAAFALHEQFRPVVPGGVRGWGAKGMLDLRLIRSLAKR